MIAHIENGLLRNDLDANFFFIRNLAGLEPPPPGLVQDDDPRLSDARAPLPGSVTNDSVALDAAIDQSKLNLNGAIPPAWLGSTAIQAAPGNLVEYTSRKGQPNGYASLDGGGLVPTSQLPPVAGVGTVTSVGLAMPANFSVSGSPVTTSGTISVSWASVAAYCWFGNNSGISAPPTFNTGPLPASLIPSLDAAKITSGIFAVARLPLAVGIGAGHAIGMVPDPGASGNAADYLARDMTYKAVPVFGPTYQPTLPNCTFVAPGSGGIAISNTVAGANIFYSLTAATGPFQPYTGVVTVTPGQTIWAYAARAGYTNSAVTSYTA